MGLALAGALMIAAGAQAQEAAPRVYVLPTDGIVDQIMAGYLREALAKAEREGFAAVVIKLDTPGGDLASTDAIVQTLLDAPLPVITWVAPSGARAASAGTFITMAGHVALMAPGTRIGAATPISGSGEDIPEDLKAKVMQDTQAMLRAIKELRPERNTDWGLTTVTEARAYTANEAIAASGVDGIAGTLEEALTFATGRTVLVKGQPVTLSLTGATTTDLPMNPLQSLLRLLADPNIAFILFTVGTYGLIYEVISPNFATGIIGAIAIVLAFIGFGSLPLNIGGLLLIGLAVIMFVLEVTVTSHGLLTIGGIVCFVLGAAALYTEPGLPGAPDVSVALPVIVTMTVATAAFMFVVVFAALRTRNMPTAEGLIGAGLVADAVGEVRLPLTPIGSVYAGGEEWTARAADERSLPRGTPVRVVRQEGLTLVVEPASQEGTN